jgi:hypothetical protein
MAKAPEVPQSIASASPLYIIIAPISVVVRRISTRAKSGVTPFLSVSW